MKIEKIDFSQISAYSRCPFAWKKRYIDKVKTKPSENLRLGSAIHALLECYGRQSSISLSGKRSEVYRASPTKPGDKILKQEWDEQARKYALSQTSYDEGLEMMKAFVKSYPTLDPACVEEYFEMPISNCILYGTIDRVDVVDQRKLFVMDYKSSRTIPSRQDVDDNLQLSIYCMAMRDKFGWINKTINAGLHMLRFDVILWTQRGTEDDKKTLDYCEMMVDRIRRDEECKPNINEFCTWCDVSGMCEAYQEAVESKEIRKTENMNEIVEEYERLSNNARILYAEKKKLEEQIKAHIGNNGPICVGEKTYNMSVTRNKTYPAMELLMLLEKYNAIEGEKDLNSLLSAKNQELTKLLGKLNPLDYQLAMEELKKIVKYRCHSRIAKKVVK